MALRAFSASVSTPGPSLTAAEKGYYTISDAEMKKLGVSCSGNAFIRHQLPRNVYVKWKNGRMVEWQIGRMDD